MSKIIILGAGMVGGAMAVDMAKAHQVTLVDIDREALERVSSRNRSIHTIQQDITQKEPLQKLIEPFDLVLSAVPGFMGFATLQAIIEARMNVVDISFFPEDALTLDTLAKTMEVTAIVDCGVAPGMDNVLLGYYNEKMKLTHFECLVGGLPKVKKWPFCYKAPFSPIDVMEEYTRPARYVENGRIVIREALTDVVHETFEGIGTLESFNSDGLRSILYTMSHIPNMKEKTLRYPGHAEYIRVLKESGFFNKTRIQADGAEVSPLAFTCKVLFDEWKLGENEEELTVMRVTLQGENEQGQHEKIIYDLFDEYDTQTQTSSMARTTGYTATAAAHLFLNGLFDRKGVFPPELIGKHEDCFEFLINYLAERGVHYKKSHNHLNG